jgi:hypothetical protein
VQRILPTSSTYSQARDYPKQCKTRNLIFHCACNLDWSRGGDGSESTLRQVNRASFSTCIVLEVAWMKHKVWCWPKLRAANLAMLGMIRSLQLEASKSIRKRVLRLARVVSHCISSRNTGAMTSLPGRPPIVLGLEGHCRYSGVL